MVIFTPKNSNLEAQRLAFLSIEGGGVRWRTTGDEPPNHKVKRCGFHPKTEGKAEKAAGRGKKLGEMLYYSNDLLYFCRIIVKCGLQNMSDTIKHTGTVESIEGSHVRVRIVQTSACANCAAHKYCNSTESKEKTIDVHTREADHYHVGQAVEVQGTVSMGMRAVLWAFGVPCVVMIAVLCATLVLADGNETAAAIAAILSLAVYYLIIYMCRERIEKKFVFTMKSIN